MSVVSELLGHLKSHGPSTVAELRKVSGSISENSTATMLSSLRGRGMARKRSDGRWELGAVGELELRGELVRSRRADGDEQMSKPKPSVDGTRAKHRVAIGHGLVWIVEVECLDPGTNEIHEETVLVCARTIQEASPAAERLLADRYPTREAIKVRRWRDGFPVFVVVPLDMMPESP